MRRSIRSAAHLLVALLPQAVKKPIYRRLFGFDIADGASIGLSVLDVDHLRMDAGAKIGHGNLLTQTQRVELGENAEIGFLNVLRGGDRIALGSHATVFRFNVLNSIPDNDAHGTPDPQLELGEGSIVVSGHRLDFTDRITIGKNVIVAGRNSSLWTHNRQETKPITIGDFCYVGSETRLAPGASMGELSMLGLGGVLVSAQPPRTVSGGVPAKVIRETTAEDERVLRKKSRDDIPEDLY